MNIIPIILFGYKALRNKLAKVCGDCGNDIQGGEKFCTKCGSDDIVSRDLYRRAPSKASREALAAQKKKDAERRAANRERRRERQRQLLDAKRKWQHTNKIKSRREELENAKICDACNIYVTDKSKFCGRCGSLLRSITSAEIDAIVANM